MNTEEKANELYPNNKTFCGGVAQIARDAFAKGARMQKDEMMKEAIEATLDNTAYPTRLWFNTFLSEYSNNDKVRIIIVKED